MDANGAAINLGSNRAGSTHPESRHIIAAIGATPGERATIIETLERLRSLPPGLTVGLEALL